MPKYLPIIISLAIVVSIAIWVINKKTTQQKRFESSPVGNIGNFNLQETCATPPRFLNKINIPQPVVIDLSQKRYKGIAFHYGKNYSKVLHPKIWEQYEHFSTYTVDDNGNIFLIPTPFISIQPITFNLQKNIYKLDTHTGKIAIFMHFENINPSASNPYGLNTITFDCEDKTLWAAAIDESNYKFEKGRIFHIDPKQKEIVEQIEGLDALSLSVIKTRLGKYLLVGAARDNSLYAYDISKKKHTYEKMKILSLPLANERIRKIKVIGQNILELQSLPFSYSLVAQSSKQDRTFYTAEWNTEQEKWIVVKK